MLSKVKGRLFDIKNCMSSKESLDRDNCKMLEAFDREVSARNALKRITNELKNVTVVPASESLNEVNF